MQEDLKVLSYNVFLMPNPLGYLFKNSARLPEFPAALRPFHILGLIEVIELRKQKYFQSKMKDTHPYWATLKTPKEESVATSPGGLLLLSQYPMLSVQRLIFKNRVGFDRNIKKGAILAKIQTGESQVIEVLLTHLQAHQSVKNRSARELQLKELVTFINENHDPKLPLLMMGDFNIPGALVKQYDFMMSIFSKLGNVVDLYASQHTDNGYTYDGVENPLSWGKDRSRIDYLFLLDQSQSVKVKETIIHKFPMKRPVGKAKYLSDHYGLEAILSLPN